ncbi:hypothetical protein FRB94_010016 [Tulasnella sp. JGI-2019a]|nr:hypothetical protein FRB94_010016 [Tulasnella sp. JGI-2019a]KAG9031715.1 hypothetical protein FRB95_002387 [Tulasnella sp. JGI-2019a]
MSKGRGISSASFLDLKSELFKKENEFKKAKDSGKGRAEPIVGGVKRADKKPSVWAKKNKGVAERSARDIELEEVSQQTVESARAALERKSKIYEKLQKGLHGGINEKQYDALLVDFDKKAEAGESFESNEDDVDESLTVPEPPRDDDAEDPIVEYQDEYGRARTARRSEVPREFLREPEVEEQEQEYDPNIICEGSDNPEGHFPTYEPSAARLEKINADLQESLKDPLQHYDASRDNRSKGAGFYQFSADEETRRREMEELKAARNETVEERQAAGADVPDISSQPEGKVLSRAGEKRKRDLEERRKLIEAKRKKADVNTLAADPV